MPAVVVAALAARQSRLDQKRHEAIDADEAQWLEEVEGIAVRPMLAKAAATMVSADWREGLHGFACAFDFAADQHRRRKSVERAVCRALSNAFDRLWLWSAFLAPRTSVQEAFA